MFSDNLVQFTLLYVPRSLARRQGYATGEGSRAGESGVELWLPFGEHFSDYRDVLNFNVEPMFFETFRDEAAVAVVRFSSLQSRQTPSRISRRTVLSICRARIKSRDWRSYSCRTP
jgi:hypothetical protein